VSDNGGSSHRGVDKDDPDLVAYWKFDEGAGYVVRDVTGHGHDLYLTEEPRWSVVRWLSTCGNGVVEDGEECDDGDTNGGNGCSANCFIEDGYECHGSPSQCTYTGLNPAFPPHADGGMDPTHTTGSPTPGGSRAGAIAAGVLVPVAVLVLLGVAWTYRGAIADAAPAVGAAGAGLARAVSRALPGKQLSDRYAHLSLDPEELDISPDFLNPMPTRGPGAAGPYMPFPDNDAPSTMQSQGSHQV